MDEHRNRSAGWRHAKQSGHKNEVILNIDIGGIHAKNVFSVLGCKTTKSKSDMYVSLSDGSNYNISIKKSLGGQVYLIDTKRFINGFEIQYNKIIPDDVKRAIGL